MLEFGNTIDILYSASVISSAYTGTLDGSTDQDYNTQETVTYFLDR